MTVGTRSSGTSTTTRRAGRLLSSQLLPGRCFSCQALVARAAVVPSHFLH